MKGGMLEFVIAEKVLFSAKINGTFRFGVSLVEEGQCCEIVEIGASSSSQGDLRPAPGIFDTQPPILNTVSTCRWGHDLAVDMTAQLGVGGFGTTYKAKLAGIAPSIKPVT